MNFYTIFKEIISFVLPLFKEAIFSAKSGGKEIDDVRREIEYVTKKNYSLEVQIKDMELKINELKNSVRNLKITLFILFTALIFFIIFFIRAKYNL